jgi:hypothetical protein
MHGSVSMKQAGFGFRPETFFGSSFKTFACRKKNFFPRATSHLTVSMSTASALSLTAAGLGAVALLPSRAGAQPTSPTRSLSPLSRAALAVAAYVAHPAVLAEVLLSGGGKVGLLGVAHADALGSDALVALAAAAAAAGTPAVAALACLALTLRMPLLGLLIAVPLLGWARACAEDRGNEGEDAREGSRRRTRKVAAAVVSTALLLGAARTGLLPPPPLDELKEHVTASLRVAGVDARALWRAEGGPAW